MSDNESFTELPIMKRKQNLNNLSEWLQSPKMAIANTELFQNQIFDQLYEFCGNQNLHIPEFSETKHIMNIFYKKAQRIQLKPKVKPSQKKRFCDAQIEDVEVEKNREILKEVKQKIAMFNKLNIPLPFIINFIRMPKFYEKFKLIIVVNDSLLDCLNWYLGQGKITLQVLELPKMKELLIQQLNIISKERLNLRRELSEVFFRLKKQFWYPQLEKLSLAPDVNPYLQNSSKILFNLAQFCEGLQFIISPVNHTNWSGMLDLTKILLTICWNEQIPVPEILMHTKISGRFEKVKKDETRSTVLRLRKRITFLRQIYKVPQIYQQCAEHCLVPLELSLSIPQYLQEQYTVHMAQKRAEICPSNKDYFIESQLQLLIREFSSLKYKIRQIYRDIRFLRGKNEIFDLYKKEINQYDGNFERIQSVQNRRLEKDIRIVWMMKHLEIMVNQEIFQFQPIKYEYLQTKKKFEFLSLTYEKIYVNSKAYFIKLFLLDKISEEQPFPYFFDFLSYESGQFQQGTYNTQGLGQFLYCPQVRKHFFERYGYNILLSEKDDVVTFTYIPIIHQEYTKEIFQFSWDEIFTEHLKLLIANKHYFKEEILQIINSKKFQTLKQQITNDKQIVKEKYTLICQIEEFQKQRTRVKNQQQQ